MNEMSDASSPTYAGVSFNDLHSLGPTLKDDLFTIVLRFCKYLCVFSGDIKMYKQVLIDVHQWHLQKIIWRFS